MMSKSGSFVPLFSFNMIVDTDLGLLNYVFAEFRNEDIFDLNVLDYPELINKVYFRQFQNPLYCLMRYPENVDDKQFLDECYKEFIETKEKEILNHSLTTQIAELLKLFLEESSIYPYIMCYTEAQYDLISKQDDYKKAKIVMSQDIISVAQGYFSQYYFKYLEELYLFSSIKDRTMYISNCGLNLNNERSDFRNFPVLDNLLRQNNHINAIDMYKEEIIGKDIYYYGTDNS